MFREKTETKKKLHPLLVCTLMILQAGGSLKMCEIVGKKKKNVEGERPAGGGSRWRRARARSSPAVRAQLSYSVLSVIAE